MTNAEKFKNIFGLYATELWAKSEKEFLKWLNTETGETHCENLVDRQAAIDGQDANHIERRSFNDWQEGWHSALYLMKCKNLDELPSAQPERCKELKQLRAEKDFSDPPDLESYKKGFIDGFNEGYKARERDAN